MKQEKLCNADLNRHVLIYIEVLTISHIVLYMAHLITKCIVNLLDLIVPIPCLTKDSSPQFIFSSFSVIFSVCFVAGVKTLTVRTTTLLVLGTNCVTCDRLSHVINDDVICRQCLRPPLVTMLTLPLVFLVGLSSRLSWRKNEKLSGNCLLEFKFLVMKAITLILYYNSINCVTIKHAQTVQNTSKAK